MRQSRQAARDRTPSPRAGDRRGADAALWACVPLFAVSGFAALIYEIVWFQLLQLVVGSSAVSLGILLAAYMGGMCLGSLLVPRMLPLSRRPLRVYALLELGVGAFGLVELALVPLVQGLYSGSGAQGLVGLVLRAAIAGLCLIPPTVLMGATFPTMARWVDTTPVGVSWMGILYASNAIGAVAGCLFAGFYLLRAHDLATATCVAASVNLGIGLVCFGNFFGGGGYARRAADAPHSREIRSAIARPACVVAGISGLCALGAEVVWTRLMSLLLGATVYSFSIVLAVFLFGVALGGAAGAALARSNRRPWVALGASQLLLVAAIAWAAYMMTQSLPYWPIAPAISLSPWLNFQLDLARCLWAVLPAALLWGASFPLALAAAALPGEDPAELAASVYASNTVGAIVGALGFSLLAVPLAGTRVAEQLLIGLACASGCIAFGQEIRNPVKSLRRLAGAAVLLIALLASLAVMAGVAPIPGGLIAYGRSLAFRVGAWDPRTQSRPTLDILYAGEGLNESVAVSEQGGVRLFHASGKIEASTNPKDMRLQRMLGAIPALVHPHPQSVLIVGFGAGVTAGSFVPYPSIRRIVICELEPLVLKRVAGYFEQENYAVARDSRTTIVYDDARHFLLTTKEKFDVITSDPIHPWVKGSAALYSSDYFDLVKRHLNPGGTVSQWVPLYQASESTIKGEVATFFSAFPNGSIWANNERGQGYDLVLLGTDRATTIDLDALNARLKSAPYAAVSRSLQEVGFGSVVDLLATYTTRRSDLAPWLAGAQITSDRRPWLQYQAGLESYTEQEGNIYASISSYRIFPEDLFVGSDALKQALKSHP